MGSGKPRLPLVASDASCSWQTHGSHFALLAINPRQPGISSLADEADAPLGAGVPLALLPRGPYQPPGAWHAGDARLAGKPLEALIAVSRVGPVVARRASQAGVSEEALLALWTWIPVEAEVTRSSQVTRLPLATQLT